jgi:acetolactate synthase-1/2/3 large subunit
MNEERLNHLFGLLSEATGVLDIAYHRIADGRINPVLKTNTDALGIERWKSVHAQSPVYIAHDILLTDLVREPRAVAIQDVKNDRRSPEEFFLFGIDSLLIIPILKGAAVEGIVVVASIGKLHEFSEQEIANAERLVEQYREIF